VLTRAFAQVRSGQLVILRTRLDPREKNWHLRHASICWPIAPVPTQTPAPEASTDKRAVADIVSSSVVDPTPTQKKTWLATRQTGTHASAAVAPSPPSHVRCIAKRAGTQQNPAASTSAYYYCQRLNNQCLFSSDMHGYSPPTQSGQRPPPSDPGQQVEAT
jgi:hypothetical protein